MPWLGKKDIWSTDFGQGGVNDKHAMVQENGHMLAMNQDRLVVL